MAITRTRATTETFTRLDLMKVQVKRVLLRCRASKSHVSTLLQGMDKKWISQVLIYGFDDAGKCHAALILEIDWERNRLHITAGREAVDIDDRWTDDIAIEVDAALELFEQYCSEKGLQLETRSRFGPDVDAEEARRVLGLSVAAPVDWADGSRIGSVMSVPEIDEFSVGLTILEG